MPVPDTLTHALPLTNQAPVWVQYSAVEYCCILYVLVLTFHRRGTACLARKVNCAWCRPLRQKAVMATVARGHVAGGFTVPAAPWLATTKCTAFAASASTKKGKRKKPRQKANAPSRLERICVDGMRGKMRGVMQAVGWLLYCRFSVVYPVVSPPEHSRRSRV